MDNNEIRQNIHDLFSKINEPEPAPPTPPSTPEAKPKMPRRKFTVLSEEEEHLAIKIGLDEMEFIREAFLDFQEAIAECTVLEYLYEEIQEFADACVDMVELINNEVNPANLSDTGKTYYNKMQDFRNALLNDLINRHKDGDNAG